MSLVAFNANARADELPTPARDTSLNDGLTVRQRPAVAFPINGMTLNKELRDKQMTGIGGGLRPDVLSESKRTATWRCTSPMGQRWWQYRKPNSASPTLWRGAQLPVRARRHGRPQTHPARVRAIAGISRRSHAHPVARQVAAGLPGWPALQGAGQQHGRAVHGVDRQAHCRAARGQNALPLRVQRDRSGLSRMGAAGLGACRLCRGGEVSERGLGASLAASAELGGYDTP
jgi:hypothetical protein